MLIMNVTFVTLIILPTDQKGRYSYRTCVTVQHLKRRMLMKQSDISKGLLAEALLLLMKKKEYKDITVKDIAEKAGVSRLTFYRNFDSKENILAWHIEQGFQEYLSSLTRSPENDLRSAISLCFSFWEKRSEEITVPASEYDVYPAAAL